MSRQSGESGWDRAVGAKRGKYGLGSLGWVLAQYRQSPDYMKLKPTTKRTYEQAFDRLHAYGHEDIAGLRRRHVMKIRDDLAGTPAAANAVLTAIGVLCRFAIDREMIDVDPSRGIKRLKLGEWRRWTDGELARFYTETYEAMRRVLILGLFTGQRRSDLCRAVWTDIEAGGIKVVQQKTGAKLWIPLHPTLAQHVAEWKRDTSTVTILAHSERKPWQPGILSTAFNHEVRRLELAGCTIHGLRKTAAAKLAEAGASTRQIMAITGHASLSEVERYTREAEQRQLATDAMERFVGPTFKTVVKPLKRKG